LISDIKRGTYTEGVFEKRVLRRIFGSKMDEVTGGRRKLHRKQLQQF
jgi:hypothetical protein